MMDRAPHLLLYGNRDSGHSYKVKLALTFLGMAHEYRSVDLSLERNARPKDFRDVSRYGEVPVLVVDGKPVVQSNAILLYLTRMTGRLEGEFGLDRLTEWLCWEANRIGFSVANLRFTRTFKPDTSQDVVEWMEARAIADLDRLSEELQDGRNFLLGRAVSMADISCCGYLFWPEETGLDYSRWPHVKGWLDRLKALPGWADPYTLMR